MQHTCLSILRENRQSTPMFKSIFGDMDNNDDRTMMMDVIDNRSQYIEKLMTNTYNYGIESEKKKDIDTAIFWYKKGVIINHLPSLCALGRLYLHGKGVEQDTDKARYLFSFGVNIGDKDSIIWYNMIKHYDDNLPNLFKELSIERKKIFDNIIN